VGDVETFIIIIIMIVHWIRSPIIHCVYGCTRDQLLIKIEYSLKLLIVTGFWKITHMGANDTANI